MVEVRYSIKDLEHFTKIKAHTIRIWEQRYNLLSPKRTDTNIRYYSEEDVKKILNINMLYNHGYKISKIAMLSEPQIVEHVKQIIEKETHDFQSELDDLIVAILNFEKHTILELFQLKYEQLGLVNLYTGLIIPLFQKIGELWQVNTIEVAQEHFFSNLFREFLLVKTNELPHLASRKKVAILFLHDTEEHEFSLLIYQYLLKKQGYYCIYLGQHLPMKDLSSVHVKTKPELIVTSFISKISEKEFAKAMDLLVNFSESSTIVISGMQAHAYAELVPKNIHLVSSIEELNNHLI